MDIQITRSAGIFYSVEFGGITSFVRKAYFSKMIIFSFYGKKCTFFESLRKKLTMYTTGRHVLCKNSIQKEKSMR